MASAPIPSMQGSPSQGGGPFDAHFYAFLKSLLARIATLEAENAELRTALNEVRANPTTVYPAI